MQLMTQFSVNEAKYSFVLENKALAETDQLTVLGKWCHTELRAGSQERKCSSGPGPPETETENKLKHPNCTIDSGKFAANQEPGLWKEEERHFSNNKEA